jgi:hypothetical protein
LPVPETVVDEALQNQALQAEQAAERLLELNDDETNGPIQPRRAAIISNEAMRTPLTKRAGGTIGGRAISDVFKDSPDLRNGEAAGEASGQRNWWMKRADRECRGI